MSLLKKLLLLVLFVTSVKSSVVGHALAPVAAVAPPISYAHAIPYNVPPFAASVNVFNRVLPALAAPVLHAAPLAAPFVPVAPALPAVLPQARFINPPRLLPGLAPAPFPFGAAAPIAYAPAFAPGIPQEPFVPGAARAFVAPFGAPPVASALAGPAIAPPLVPAPALPPPVGPSPALAPPYYRR